MPGFLEMEEFFSYILVYSAEHEPKYEQVIVNAVPKESLAVNYAALKDAGIRPKVRMTEQKISQKLDKKYLSRILTNVISNAVKYCADDLEARLSDNGEIRFTNHVSNLDLVSTAWLFDRFYTVEHARG